LLLTKEGDKEVLVDDDELNDVGRETASNDIRLSPEFGSTTDKRCLTALRYTKDLKPIY
jgi:hypothetical protein